MNKTFNYTIFTMEKTLNIFAFKVEPYFDLSLREEKSHLIKKPIDLIKITHLQQTSSSFSIMVSLAIQNHLKHSV